MRSMVSHAADGFAIQPRDKRFTREALARRWWLGGDPIATAFFNSVSAALPRGEAFFVETLKKFREGASPKLAADIDAFVKQEVVHAREHIAFNRRIDEAGYDMKPLDAKVERRLTLLRQKSPIAGLAGTLGLEHLTAVFAHHVLSNPRHLKSADPEIADMWRWHCVEEIEHKSVTFDVWQHVTRDWSNWKRWSIRNKAMLFIMRRFIQDRYRGAIELLRQDGLTGPRIWLALGWYTLVRPGMVRLMLQGWAKFAMPGFNPWDHNDRHLVESWTKSNPLPA